VGADETPTLVGVEATLEYHPGISGILTLARERVGGRYQADYIKRWALNCNFNIAPNLQIWLDAPSGARLVCLVSAFSAACYTFVCT
jgi:hypothetical protein